MIKTFFKLLSSRKGATGIEYALIGMLVSVAFIIGATFLGQKTDEKYTHVADRVAEAMDSQETASGNRRE